MAPPAAGSNGGGKEDETGKAPAAGLNPTQKEVDSLRTTRNYVIGAFVLLAVAGQVLVARKNASHLKDVSKRLGVKFEAPPKKPNAKDDDWW